MKKHLTLLCALALIGVVSAQDDYTLVWNQDFTGTSLNKDAWNIEVNGDGGGNNELQYYCEKGVSLGIEPTTGKHCLILTATKEDYKGKKCTSGRVNSKSKTYFTFGKIEARIKFPNTANGLWPAFWMMGNNYSQVGWPKCGETDIIELGNSSGFNGKQDRYFNGAMHIGRAWNADWCDAQSTTWSYSVEDTFHIITCEWTPTSVKMYMDKDAHPEYQPYFQTKLEPNDDADYNRQLVFGKPFFIIFNLAVGGNFPGLYDIDKITALANGPANMYIDWVRVYQRGDDGQTFQSTVQSDPIESTPTGIMSPAMQQAKPTKIIRDGRLYFRHQGAYYDVLGHICSY